MKYLQLLEYFVENNQNIKIYHGTLKEEDAITRYYCSKPDKKYDNESVTIIYLMSRMKPSFFK